jgi:threonine/homoserine/homoserine lactone efflux protein
VPDSSFSLVLAYAAIAAVLVVTPGVGTASLIATVVAHGRRAGYLTAAGMVAGAAIYALGAAVGTTALLRAFPRALQWVAIGGGAFIVWLGSKGLLRGVRGVMRGVRGVRGVSGVRGVRGVSGVRGVRGVRGVSGVSGVGGVRGVRGVRGVGSTDPKPTGRHAFVATGTIIALGNAPLPLFYLVVVPQYVPKSMSPLGGALLLSGIHLLMAGTWMATLVTLLGRLADVLRRPRVLLTMQLVTGVALILLGLKSIFSVSS